MTDTKGPVKFHLSLSVNDLARSSIFYESLFDIPPARREPDYVKFEVDVPPLVLSLTPDAVVPGGAVNHVGLRMADSAGLVAVQYRLEAAGFATQREENVACCYSRQTKFWVADPDRTLWEIYVLENSDPTTGSDAPPASVAHRGPAVPGLATTGQTSPVPARASEAVSDGGLLVWRHSLGQSIPGTIPHPIASLDEVRLEGTFNLQLPPGHIGQLLAEIARTLRPGATLYLHGLVADRLLSKKPMLPGPAALVERVPLAVEPERCLAAAGFVNIKTGQCSQEPRFVVEGVPLRELKLTAQKPGEGAAQSQAGSQPRIAE